MANSAPHPFTTFRGFWPHYVDQHRHPLCRAIHYVGSVAVLAIAATVCISEHWVWLLLVPLIGYGPAWMAHVCVEGNRPASWNYPWWSLVADFRMLGLAVIGRMHAEVAHLDQFGNRSKVRIVNE